MSVEIDKVFMIKKHVLAWIDYYRSQPVLKDAGFSVIGNTLATALSGLALILFSRTLGPIEFGLLSVGFSLMLIISRVTEGGWSAVLLKYIPIAQDDRERNNFFWSTFVIKIFLAVIVALIFTVFSSVLAKILHVPVVLIIAVVWLTPITLIFDHLATMAIALLKIQLAVIGNLTQAGIKMILGGLIWITQYGLAVPSLSAYLIAPLPAYFFYFKVLPKYLRFNPQTAVWKNLLNSTKAMAFNNWFAGINQALVQNIDVVLVSALLTAEEVGHLGAGVRLAMFVMMVGFSLAGVLIPRVAALQNEQDLNYYWKKALLFLLLCLSGSILLPFFAEILLLITVGTAYLPATATLQLLLISAGLSIGMVGFSSLFFRYNSPAYFSISSLLQLLIIVGLIFSLAPGFGILSVGIARLSAQIFLLILTIIWALFAHRKEFGEWPLLKI